jgi:hypothetical protein
MLQTSLSTYGNESSSLKCCLRYTQKVKYKKGACSCRRILDESLDQLDTCLLLVKVHGIALISTPVLCSLPGATSIKNSIHSNLYFNYNFKFN